MTGPVNDPTFDPEKGEGPGWRIGGGYPVTLDDIQPVLDDLNIPGETIFRNAFQQYPFTNCFHRELAKTEAQFQTYYNVGGGTIICAVSFGAKYKLLLDPARAQPTAIPPWRESLPKVTAMSDILWVQWVNLANSKGIPEKISGLKYVFRHQIVTTNTLYIMELAGNGADAPAGQTLQAPWPGKEFAMGSEQFEALMGTVHAISIVTLLVTHPNELGTKSIEKITVFTTDDDYHMLLTLTD